MEFFKFNATAQEMDFECSFWMLRPPALPMFLVLFIKWELKILQTWVWFEMTLISLFFGYGQPAITRQSYLLLQEMPAADTPGEA